MINNIQYWDRVLRRLRYPVHDKLIKLLKYDRIQKINNGYEKYVCLPIRGIAGVKDYNSTTYYIQKINGDIWHCSCQGYRSNLAKTGKPTCVHVVAIRVLLKQQEKDKRVQRSLFQ